MTTESRLIELGGTTWEKGGNKRIYIDSPEFLEEFFGLVVEHYKTGSIKRAELNGEKLSNNKAHKLLSGAIYFDCKFHCFCGINLDPIK